jgi:hypothetical protein
MAARCANQAARRVRLQPTLALAAIPDAILWPEHPAAALAVQDCEVSHGETKGSGLQAAVATLVDQQPVSGLGVRKWIDSHPESIAP